MEQSAPVSKTAPTFCPANSKHSLFFLDRRWCTAGALPMGSPSVPLLADLRSLTPVGILSSCVRFGDTDGILCHKGSPSLYDPPPDSCSIYVHVGSAEASAATSVGESAVVMAAVAVGDYSVAAVGLVGMEAAGVCAAVGNFVYTELHTLRRLPLDLDLYRLHLPGL